MAFSKIGFHTGPGGNAQGIADYMHRLDAAGIPFVLKSVEDYGVINESMQYQNAAHVRVFRLSNRADGGPQFDTPNYNLDAKTAAQNHWQMTLDYLPPEFDRSVWLEVINEPDKNRADWLGWFGVEIAALAAADGYRVALFGFSGGEPEPEHWITPGMIAYLIECTRRPSSVAVALHEYSFDRTNIRAGFPWLVGRFQFLHDACDGLDIPYPTILITEWGWEYDNVPGVETAVSHIADIAELYAAYPNILGAAIWYLGGNFGDIHNQTQKLILPVTEYTLAARFPDPEPVEPPIDPPDGGGGEPVAKITRTRIQGADILRTHGATEVSVEFMTYHPDGRITIPGPPVKVPVPPGTTKVRADVYIDEEFELDTGGAASKPPQQYARVSHVIPPDATPETAAAIILEATTARQTITYSYDDAGYAPGFESNTAVLWNIAPEKQQEFIEWYADRYPNTAVTFKGAAPKADSPLDGLELGQLFTVPYVQTSAFNAERSYGKHEGADFDVIGTNPNSSAMVLCTYDGVVERSLDSTGGYGKYVRVVHTRNGRQFYTRYCHLDTRVVSVGQTIQKGDPVGEIGTSGNVTGEHVHFNLEVPGFGLSGYVVADVVDPVPYLPKPISQPSPPPVPPAQSYYGPAVTFTAALHQPGSDWMWQMGEIQGMFDSLAMPVKWLSDGINPDYYGRFNKANFHLVRINWKPGGTYRSPAEAWGDVRDGVLRFYNQGARKFEFLNETNLPDEGFGVCWQNGEDFGRWLAEFIGYAKGAAPEIKVYFPGMSPGVPWTNQFAFTDKAWPHVASLCDGVCLHAYTGITDSVNAAVADIVEQVKAAQSYKWLDRPLIVSEASVNRAPVGVSNSEIAAYKAAVYRGVEAELAKVPGIEAVVWFVSHWNPPAAQQAHKESWLDIGLADKYKS